MARLASLSGVVFVSVVFDLLRAGRLFATAGIGLQMDRNVPLSRSLFSPVPDWDIAIFLAGCRRKRLKHIV